MENISSFTLEKCGISERVRIFPKATQGQSKLGTKVVLTPCPHLPKSENLGVTQDRPTSLSLASSLCLSAP